MSIVIPCASGIGVLGTITLYHLYLNSIFEGTYKDKLYYLNSHIITLIPILIYLIMILNEVIIGQIQSLIYFYIDWIITTPLILTKLGYFTSIPLNSYIYIILLDELMIMSGYVSYITQNNALSYAMFSLGSLCYILLNSIFLKNIKPLQKQNLKNRIFCKLYYSIAFTWIFYPIIHILLKTNNITQNTAISVYVSLDVLTKGIFTTLLIGSREIYQRHNSWLKNLINKLCRVHPYEINPVQESIEDLTYIIKIYNKEENKIQNKESITINPHSTDNTESVRSVKDDTTDNIMEILERYKSPRKISVISTLDSIDEKERETP